MGGLSCRQARSAVVKFTKENVAKVKNQPGNYYFYDCRGTLLYVGWSAILKHRLQSYYQKDDFSAHPTKKVLRSKIHAFTVHYRPKKKAQAVEMKMKGPARYKFMKAGIRR